MDGIPWHFQRSLFNTQVWKEEDKQRECWMLRNLHLMGLDLKVTAFHPPKAGISIQKSCLTLILSAAVRSLCRGE